MWEHYIVSSYNTVHPYKAVYIPYTILYRSHGLLTALYTPIQHRTVLYSTVYPNTALYTRIQCCTSLYSPVYPHTTLYTPIQPCTPLYSPVHPYTALYTTIKHSTALYSTKPRFGLKIAKITDVARRHTRMFCDVICTREPCATDGRTRPRNIPLAMTIKMTE